MNELYGNVISVVTELNQLVSRLFGDTVVKNVIAYYSETAKRGPSDLGLEWQRAAVNAFVARRGCKVVANYTVGRAGGLQNDPQLVEAMDHARRSKATLVIPRSGRLTRDRRLITNLMEADVDFIVIDLDQVNRLTIRLLSAVVEGDAKSKSDRTRAALQAAKARGTALGSARPGHWDGREEARREGAVRGAAAAAQAHKQAADEAYAVLFPIITDLRAAGRSLQQIADALNAEGHTTRRGMAWNPVQVGRVLKRSK